MVLSRDLSQDLHFWLRTNTEEQIIGFIRGVIYFIYLFYVLTFVQNNFLST